jgi:Glycosyltransferase family 87
LPVELDSASGISGVAFRQYSMSIISRHPAASIFVLAHLLMGAAFATFGWDRTWISLGFVELPPYFTDLRTVAAAPEAMALGYDPLIENPTDPLRRPMNYPRIWAYMARYVHLNLPGLTAVGIAFWLLFVASVLLIIHVSGPEWRNNRYVLLAALSSASWFPLHQGNNDLLMFFLTVVSLYVFGRCKSCSLAMVAAATMLKVYPIILFPVLVSRDNGRIVNAGIIGTFAACLGFWLYNVSDLQLIRAGNTALVNHTYGFGSLHSIPKILPSYEGMLWETNGKWELVFFIVCAVCAVCIFLLGFISGNKSSRKSDATAELLFIGGATLYTGTFVLGNNWDYRLIFLILCVPYIALMPRTLRYVIMAALLISMNYWTFTYIGAALSHSSSKVQFVLTMFIQLAKCSLCALLLYELGQVMRRRLTADSESRQEIRTEKPSWFGARATP